MKPSILIIYTGGTIGMKEDSLTGTLIPFQFNDLVSEVPQLQKFGYNLNAISFSPLVDSSDIRPEFWLRLTSIISREYDNYDGFVILHGTDTMSYTASALSFMLNNLEKPIIITGSQLPIGVLRTDGKENFISAIEIAAARRSDGHALVPEVCIFFQNQLFRGNRTTKDNAEEFHAFRSPNYPPLAEAGVHIKYNMEYIHCPEQWGQKLETNTDLCCDVLILKLFPGLTEQNLRAVLGIKGLKGIVMETFGSGNAPTGSWFIDTLKEAIDRGLPILNISQCPCGSVNMDAYATGILLKQIGVLDGHDMTLESAIVKLMLSTSNNANIEQVKQFITHSKRGEFSKTL